MKKNSIFSTPKNEIFGNIPLWGGVFTLLLWVFMLEAGGDRVNEIKDIRFAPHPTFSRLIFELQKPFQYKLLPDLKGQELVLKIPDVKVSSEFKKKQITDARINGVTLKESKETGELVVTVHLRYKKNNIFHLSLEGPPRLVLDIQKKNGEEKHSARAVLDRKSFPELEEKPEPPMVVAEAPKEAAPAAPETSAPEPEKIEPILTPEEKAKYEQILHELEKKNEGKSIYAEGLKLYQETKYAEAYLKFQEFSKQFPDSLYGENAAYLMGDCQFNLLDEKKPEYTAAIQDFREAMRKYPLSHHRDAALYKLGTMYYNKGLVLEAMASMDEIIQDFGKKRYGLQAKLMKANIYYAQLDYKKAYDLYQEVILLSPYSPEAKDATFSIADYLYDTNNHEKSLEVYLEAARRWPTYPKTHPHIMFNMGNLYYKKKNYEDARKQFYSLVNLYPSFNLSGQAMTLVGDSYIREGKEVVGMKIYSEAVSRNPDSPEANYGRMRIAEIGVDKPDFAPKKKIFESYAAYYEPIETYREISQKHPDDPKAVADALLHEGAALSKKKQFFQAIGRFRKIHEKFPETVQSKEVKGMIQESFYSMVNAYYGQEGFLALLAAYHENLHPYLIDIQNTQVLFQIGDVYQKMGLHETAVQYYQKVRELDAKGEFKEAMILKLSEIHMAKGNLAEAEKALVRFLNEFPKSPLFPEALSLLGSTLFKQKNYQEAVVRYSDYVEKFPKAAELASVYALMGKTYKEMKKYAEAVDAFQNAVKKFKPDNPASPLPKYFVDSFYDIGDCYYMSGQYEKAIVAYKKAMEKFEGEPRNAYAKFFVGDSYARLKENSSAETHLSSLAESAQEIWSKAAELSNNAIKWEKGYKEVM